MLVKDFLAVTGLKIGKVRVDGAFDVSAFRAFCARRGIEVCAATAYNHMMQARIEGAIRICKEHVRCMLKTANAPTRFWPYALMQFCRTFNYWPSAKGAPPWEKMGKSKFSFDIKRDLREWGSYMTAHLP